MEGSGRFRQSLAIDEMDNEELNASISRYLQIVDCNNSRTSPFVQKETSEQPNPKPERDRK